MPPTRSLSSSSSRTSKELRAIQEQTATFSRDLGHLREELALLKSKGQEDMASGEKLPGCEDLAPALEVRIAELFGQQAECQEDWKERIDALEQESQGLRDESLSVRRLVQDVEAELVRRSDELKALLDQEFQERLAACGQLEELCTCLSRAQARTLRPLQAVPEETAMPCGSLESEAERDAIFSRLLQLEGAVDLLAADRDGGAQAALVRLEKMQGSVADCQTWLSQHAFSAQSVKDLAAKFGEQAEQSRREVKEVASAVENLRGRVLDCESLCASAVDFKETLEREAAVGEECASQELAVQASHLAALQEQVVRIERSLGKPLHGIQHSFGTEEALELRAKVESLADRLTACESWSSCAMGAGNQAVPGTFTEERQATELLALRAAHSKLAGEVHARHAELKEVFAQERRTREERGSAVEARLDSLEDALHESVHGCERAVTSMRSDHAKLVGEAKARDVRLAWLEEHLARLDEAVDSAAEERSREASDVTAVLEQFKRRIADEMAARCQHQSFVRDLFSKEKEERDADRVALTDRLERLEWDAEHPSRLAAELQTVQAAQRKLGEEAKVVGANWKAALERLDVLEDVCRAVEGQVASVAGTSGDQGCAEVPGVSAEALDPQHGRLSQQVESLEKVHVARHRSLLDRICVLEKAFESSVAANTQGLRDTQAKLERRLEKMQSKWARVGEAWHRDLEEAWHRDLEAAEVSISDGLSISRHGWETSSQCGSWASDAPAALNLASATTMAGDSSCD